MKKTKEDHQKQISALKDEVVRMAVVKGEAEAAVQATKAIEARIKALETAHAPPAAKEESQPQSGDSLYELNKQLSLRLDAVEEKMAKVTATVEASSSAQPSAEGKNASSDTADTAEIRDSLNALAAKVASALSKEAATTASPVIDELSARLQDLERRVASGETAGQQVSAPMPPSSEAALEQLAARLSALEGKVTSPAAGNQTDSSEDLVRKFQEKLDVLAAKLEELSRSAPGGDAGASSPQLDEVKAKVESVHVQLAALASETVNHSSLGRVTSQLDEVHTKVAALDSRMDELRRLSAAAEASAEKSVSESNNADFQAKMTDLMQLLVTRVRALETGRDAQRDSGSADAAGAGGGGQSASNSALDEVKREASEQFNQLSGILSSFSSRIKALEGSSSSFKSANEGETEQLISRLNRRAADIEASIEALKGKVTVAINIVVQRLKTLEGMSGVANQSLKIRLGPEETLVGDGTASFKA